MRNSGCEQCHAVGRLCACARARTYIIINFKFADDAKSRVSIPNKTRPQSKIEGDPSPKPFRTWRVNTTPYHL
jgi:hypothetical protein